ncbi:hypothetical protein EJ08DRAFT_651501 [Tothia fuscella]|uniref:Transcription elongation factor Eaf N-terminal domain-containing protein n=1 Tax=Tothia fuscella TaxID=1048955 RepID=A0A9P4NLV9_9PEZI|nr:hypothetical protein EJ08DRAFT_651501 [Tothia fuscella]
MASPALGSPFNAPLDPTKQGRYTLHLGEGITKRSSSTSTFSSVKFNHKPNLSSGTRSTKIAPQDGSHATLKITDNEEGKTSIYKYSGHQRNSKKSYALIFDQNNQTCTLQPLSSEYNFNIQSTPWEASASKLAQQYKQLQPKPTSEDAAEDFEDESSDVEPDPDNPYDYRHYLKASSRSPSPGLRPTTAANTPNLASTRMRPAVDAKPRKHPPTKTDPLRAAPRKPTKTAQRPTPTVRLDRRASTRPGDSEKRGPKLPKGGGKSAAKSDYYVHSSDEEDEPMASQATIAEHSSEDEDEDVAGAQGGGLEIDFGDSPPAKRKTKALALSGAFSVGPISLHSAANSPRSQVVTPRQQTKKSRKDDDVIDFGDSSVGYDEEEEEESDVDAPPRDRRKNDNDVNIRDASDDEGDGDVEPMTLGSPAHQQHAPDEDAEYDEADFEMQMMQELANGDGADDLPTPVVDESEESEAD